MRRDSIWQLHLTIIWQVLSPGHYIKERSGFDDPEVDPALYLRKTDWNFAYDVLTKDLTQANIEEAITVQQAPLDIDTFQAQIAVASQIDIPVVLSDYMVIY